MTLKHRDFAKHHFLFSSSFFRYLSNQRPNRSSKDQLLLFSAIVVYLLPIIILLLYQIFKTELSLQSTVKLIQKTVAALIIISCYSVSYFHFETVRLLLARFKLDHEKMTDVEELKILEKYSLQSKSFVYALMFFFYVYCCSIIFPSIFNAFLQCIGKLGNNQLTLPLVENKSYNPGVLFYSMLSYQIIFVIIVAIIGSFSISTIFVFIQHACCQNTIIKLKISQPFKRNQNKTNCLYFCTKSEEYDWIIDIITRHQNSIEFSEMLKFFSSKAYSISLFLALILLIFNYLCILQYSKILKTAEDKIESFVYVFGSLFTIFIKFHLGQNLLNHSNAVLMELCSIPFYNLSRKTQKLILFMIMRSGKPCFLSIGNLFVSSHEIFAGIMRKAFSLAMVFYSAQ